MCVVKAPANRRWNPYAEVYAQREFRSRLRHRAVQVRLLHVEPLELGVVAVGLHAHEKQVIPGDPRKTRQLQDAEIVEAVRIYGLAGPQWLRKSPAGGLHRDTDEQ